MSFWPRKYQEIQITRIEVKISKKEGGFILKKNQQLGTFIIIPFRTRKICNYMHLASIRTQNVSNPSVCPFENCNSLSNKASETIKQLEIA